MADHIVRWIRVDEGGIGGDGKMGGRDRERRIIGNENYVMSGVVIDFVSPTTVMCCSGPTIAGGKSRADRPGDLQIGFRGRVNACPLYFAISVPSPQALQGSYPPTLGSWAVPGAGAAPT